MKEKLPSGERPEIKIVGNAPIETKGDYATTLGKRFGEKHLLELRPEIFAQINDLDNEGELEKLLFEKKVIRLLNELTNRSLETFGLTPFDIPEQNIHFLPEYIYKKVEPKADRMASASLRHQAIFVNADTLRNNPLIFIRTLFHEMRHLKGYMAIEVEKRIEPGHEKEQPHYEAGGHRYGLITYATYRRVRERGSNEKYAYFEGLNEAVVDDIDPGLVENILANSDNTEAKKLVEIMQSDEFRSYRKEVAKKNKLPEENIIWVEPDAKKYYLHSYLEQRAVLNFIIQAIAEDSKKHGVLKSDKEIRNLFQRAHFTGNIVTIAKLIEKSFGKGSFRHIGTMGPDEASANRVMDYLQKQRRLNKLPEKIIEDDAKEN